LRSKLYIIGCIGVPARYGGFETFAENISRELEHDFDLTVVCSSYSFSTEEKIINLGAINRKFIRFKGTGIQSLLYDFLSLWDASGKADYLLILGVVPGIFLPVFYYRLKKKRILCHVDGLDWKRQKWGLFSKLLLRVSFRLSVKLSSVIIIDNSALVKYIPVRHHSKLKYVGYGGDHLPCHPKKLAPVTGPFALVIARAEPENNLSLILKVFMIFQKLQLIIVSNWDQTSYGRSLLTKYANQPNISLIGPIYDKNELQRYRENCLIYIHGHSAGGTNPSLVEAMYTGKPVIAWDNEFNRITTNNLSLYFKNQNELMNQLIHPKSSKLQSVGEKLKEYAQANYKWSIAADQLKAILTEN
jgi:glycosyltransferase involved in cell wall biosynthesis